jgi:uncharacterized membrane protein
VNKARLEAFSDGVFAVAITLLVLDLPVDRTSPLSLAEQLREEWPTFAAYVVSFFIIGVIWLNHHAIFHVATGVDRHILVYNLILLMFVAAIPFVTSTYAEYAPDGGMNAKVAVLLYGIVMEGMSISFTLILAHLQKTGLTGRMPSGEDWKLLARYGIGHLIYPVITLIGWFYPPAMLVLYAIVVAYYFGPGLRTLDILDASRQPG